MSSDPVVTPLPVIASVKGLAVPTFADDKEAMQWALQQNQDAVYLLRTQSGITEESNPVAYNALQRLEASLTLWNWWWSLVRW